jgi:hypothetical protein
VADFRMHDWRTTVATGLMQKGLSEREIALMTGHVLPAVLERRADAAEALLTPRRDVDRPGARDAGQRELNHARAVCLCSSHTEWSGHLTCRTRKSDTCPERQSRKR